MRMAHQNWTRPPLRRGLRAAAAPGALACCDNLLGRSVNKAARISGVHDLGRFAEGAALS